MKTKKWTKHSYLMQSFVFVHIRLHDCNIQVHATSKYHRKCPYVKNKTHFSLQRSEQYMTMQKNSNFSNMLDFHTIQECQSI
jgi:hypothetical protein